jgi:hypothetical protein
MCDMKLSLFSLFLLVGCGGDPFTTDLLRASSEAGDDVVSEAGDQDSGADNDSDTSDAKADAKPHDDSGIVGHDGGHDSGVATDSGPLPETSTDAPAEGSCAPSTFQCGTGPNGGPTTPLGNFCLREPAGGPTGQWNPNGQTPSACDTCATYNCACLAPYLVAMAGNICSGAGAFSCSDVGGQLTVVCN